MASGKEIVVAPESSALRWRILALPDLGMTTLSEEAGRGRQAVPSKTRCYAIEDEMWEKKKLPANLDFYAAPVFYSLGVPLHSDIRYEQGLRVDGALQRAGGREQADQAPRDIHGADRPEVRADR